MQKKIFIFIGISFIIWRVLLFVPVFIADQKIDYRSGYEYTNLSNATSAREFNTLDKLYLAPWANFDGVHYLFIAGNGYTNNYGFFPFYPILIKILAVVLGAQNLFDLSYFFSGFLISNLTFFLSLFVFYKLLSLDYPEKQKKLTILSLLAFPTSFFLGSIYSESLFLLLLLLSFYFARKKQWALASIFGFALTLTRFVGIFIFPVLIYEFFKESRQPLRKFLQSGIWIVPFGLMGYSIYNYIEEKNFIYFIKVQGNFLNNRSVDSVVFFPQTIYRYLKILISNSYVHFEWWIALLEITSFVFVITVLYFAWKKKVRLSYILFSLFAIFIPASSGTFSALPRYILVAFPVYIVLGLITNKFFRIIYFLISTTLLFILLFFFSKGYFIS